MEISRRNALLSGLSASVVGLLAPEGSLSAHEGGDASGPGADQTNILRHYVLATGNMEVLDRTLAELKEKLGLVSQPKKELTELGFTNGIVVIGKTVLEVVAPLAPGKRPHVEAFIKERGGPGLYKLVFQTFDAAALRKRIYAYKLKLERDQEFRGQQMITLDPEMFGTSLEAFTYAPLEKWWGYDSAKTYVQSDLVEEVMGCDLVIENPGAVSTLVASMFNAELDPEAKTVRFQKNTTVPFDERTIRFVAPFDERRGVLTLDVKVKNRARVGEKVTISGVDFRFV